MILSSAAHRHPEVVSIERAVSTTPSSPEAFVGSPIGRYVVGPTYLIWCEAPDLQGAILWGELDEASLRDMIGLCRFFEHPRIAPRRRVLVDCRDVTRADAEALLGLAALARGHVAQLANGFERQALVVPPGLVGIFLAGALPSIGLGHPLRVSRDLDAALAFLDHPHARAAHDAAKRATEAVHGTSALLLRLRSQLARRDCHKHSAADTAAALGMSTRTLYRELQRLGVKLGDEVRRARAP